MICRAAIVALALAGAAIVAVALAGVAGCGGGEEEQPLTPSPRSRRSRLPIARAGDAVVRKLRAAGYPVTYRRFRGGHEVSDATSAAAIRWFLEG